MIVLTIALGILAAVLLLPAISDVIALARAGSGGRLTRGSAQGIDQSVPRLLVLVPAHDEELLIGPCLRSLAQLRYPKDQLTIAVVADNCRDGTADIARSSGVLCLERRDTERQGKPWAIAWALKRLPVREHDALVIVDADSIVDPDFAAGIAAHAPLADKALQPYNDVDNRAENALTRMASVFSAVRFRFMNPLKDRALVNVPLANGMCVGTSVLATHGWQAFSICENWEMYAILTTLGIRIEGAPEAHLCSQEASSLRQSYSQRRRWTAGRLDVLAGHARVLLASRHVGLHQKLDAVAELTAPGPAVHLGIAVVMSALAIPLGVPGVAWVIGALALSVARPIAFTLAALRVDPEPLAAARAFAYLPVYMAWRLVVQMTAVLPSGATRWTRTARHLRAEG